jgi:mycobactin lysine-N-oxygenase
MKKVQKKLIVLGCGPKGTALGVKAKVLKDLGYDVPEVIIVEKSEVGAHWDGKHGLTHGRLPLGSAPQKDIGFPYRSLFDKKVDEAMQKYSWNAYMIENDYYVDWIDKGRLAPTHTEWAKYFKWAINKSGVKVYKGEIVKIKKENSKWNVEFINGTKHKVSGDGLVITGPGNPNQLPIFGNILKKNSIPTVLDGKNFWLYVKHFRKLNNVKIALLGGGESAASIIVALLDHVDISTVKIDLINNGHATVFTRNENYLDNMHFSDPTHWKYLSEQERIRFIKAARAGNFSSFAKNIIDEHYLNSWVSYKAVSMKYAKPLKVIAGTQNPGLVYSLADGSVKKSDYNFIISGIGFNPLSFTNLMEDKTGLLDKKDLEKKIQEDMSVQDFKPVLHLPMLSALNQGIGFSELTCLGLLADRILLPYCNKN